MPMTSKQENRKPTAKAPSKWDVFVSHASEDKDALARPLAEELRSRGLAVWYDEWELRVSDSLSEKIDEGLAQSHHGVVILSQSFFAKEWSKKELAGLVATEGGRRSRILPVWHNITRDEVASYSPTLADRKAAMGDQEMEALADELIAAMDVDLPSDGASDRPSGLSLSPPPREVELSLTPSGAAIVEQLAGRQEISFDFSAVTEPGLRSDVAGSFDELRDLAELWEQLSPPDRVTAKSRASEIAVDLLQKELLVQLGHYERRLTDPQGVSTPWSGVLIRVVPAQELAADQERKARPNGGPTASDQALLDELLGLVTRGSIKNIQVQDFSGPWPGRVMTPVKFLAYDHNEVEHRFMDVDLEEGRQRLMQAANHFLHQEALNGFVNRYVDGMRDAGYTPAEAEGYPDREKLLDRRQEVILSAANEFREAYDDFVMTAKSKGYQLDAMKSSAHPKVTEHDDSG